MKRLHPNSLADLAHGVRTPSYDRGTLGVGIVHLGLGAFHRAHQAVYTEDAIEHSGGDWGILGISLRSAAVSQQLLPQQGLYSILSEDGECSELRVIGAIKDVLVAPENLATVVDAIADPAVQIVTLTITEKGYNLAPDGESLDTGDEQLAHDLANPDTPASAVGVLALGLKARFDVGGTPSGGAPLGGAPAGTAPLTIISCDNLSENSKLLGLLLRDYLEACFPGVLPWFVQSVRFPCSMVDRIVPAMTTERRQQQAQALGCLDEGAVSTEPFSQWIIEDDFAADRPAWDKVGVQLVEDIRPYENIKLHLLNASHSAIAYCGLMAGKETVDEVMADPDLREFVEGLMANDLMPALDVPHGFDLGAYRDDLLARFSNPRLEHRCEQIAMDGSEKIGQRWLPILQRAPAPNLHKALSAWCYFILCTDCAINDPRAAELLALRNADNPLAEKIRRVLACARITAGAVGHFAVLAQEVEHNIETLRERGMWSVLAA